MFPKFQVAIESISCSPPNFKFIEPFEGTTDYLQNYALEY
jgi:hypothetical protein